MRRRVDAIDPYILQKQNKILRASLLLNKNRKNSLIFDIKK